MNSPLPHSCYLADEAETERAGAALAGVAGQGGLITLHGDLGAGKTTFCRGLIRACGHQAAVKSPTYTIVEPYDIGDTHIMHFDLYRLEDPEELDFMGFRDYLVPDNLCLVEWPEKGGPLVPAPDLSLDLRLSGRGRQLHWQAHTLHGEAFNKALLAAFRD